MNTLSNIKTLYHITNELTKSTPSLHVCLAIYLEGDRNDSLLRHDHARKEIVSSLGSSGFVRESEEQLFHPEVIL